MCRLFCWHSDEPITLDRALGADHGSLLELSSLHRDGWGMAYATGEGIDLVREPAAAAGSEWYATTANQVHSTDALVHLRWATENLAVCVENTHPFVKDGPDGPIAFMHNGGVARGEQLDALMAPDLRDALEGTTDSEQYMVALLTELRRSDGDIVAAYRELLAKLEAIHFSSLNAMILTDDDMWVLSRNIPANRPGGVPQNYYELSWQDDDGVFSAWSSGVRNSAGKVLDDGDLLHLDRASGDITIHRVI